MMVILPYRLGVGLMIINREAQVFVGKRIDTKSEYWQMPQGGIDDGENPLDAALREMKEEIGNDYGEIISETESWYSYDIPDYLIPKLWDGKYCGQKQKWYLIKYNGKDSDIKIDDSDHPEFLEWRWSQLEDLPQIIVPFKRDLYISVIEDFREEIIKIKKSIKCI